MYILNIRINCGEVLLYSPQEFTERLYAGIDDDPGVPHTSRFPCTIKFDKVPEIIGEYGTTMYGGVVKLSIIGDALVDSIRLMATDNVVTTLPEGWGKCGVDVFIREELDSSGGGHKAGIGAKYQAFRAISSSTRLGCS